MCGPHQVWPLRSECCGRGVPTKVVCAECMKMCCLGGKNSVVKGLIQSHHEVIQIETSSTISKVGAEYLNLNPPPECCHGDIAASPATCCCYSAGECSRLLDPH